MKNKLLDLNNHLFAQLERLGDEDATREEIEHEIARGHAISNVAKQIIDTGKLALNVQKAIDDGQVEKVPDHLSIEQKG